MLPRVEPPRMSERFKNTWYGTSAFSQMVLNTAAETASVQYFWFALYLMTIPWFKYGRFVGSALSGWFG